MGAPVEDVKKVVRLESSSQPGPAGIEGVLERLARAGQFRDEESPEHVERVSRTCALIARELGWDGPECGRLRFAGALHDIGKVGVPDAILQKQGSLSPVERRLVETHTEIGYEILAGSDNPGLELAATVALTHHERFDGRGYPHGLKAEDIPEPGRIAAVADVFDALTHDRAYRRAFSVLEGLEKLRDGRGNQFDPAVVDAFETVLPEIRAVSELYPDPPADTPEPAGPSLTTREREVCTLLATGLTGEEIAERLFLSPETVRTHIRNAMQRIGVKTRAQLVAQAITTGEIESDRGI